MKLVHGVLPAAFTVDTSVPASPILKTPVDNAPLVRVIPSFTWATVPGANAYQFQIDESTGFGDPLFTSPVLTVASYKPVVALTVMTPYYWHVRARDAAGNWGDYSPYRTITIVPAVPTAPVQTAPAASLITSDNTPEFTWNAVTTGNTYQIQIDNLANFSAPAAPDIDLTLGAGVRTYTPAALLDGIWYWRVRAISLNNEVGPWSTTRAFTVDTSVPASPILKTPVDNAPLVRVIPSFTWATVPGANAYQFQIDESTGFGDPLFTSPVLTVASYKPVVALTVMTPYYWHVRARDAAGNWGDYSPYRTITIVPAVPTAPVQTAPAASLITSDNTPEFTWNAVTTGNTYQIQIDNLANFSAPAAPDIDLTLGAGVRTYTPAALLDGIWYWRVRAISLNNEVGPWSTTRTFTVDTSVPASPILKTPVDNAPLVRVIPSFTWATVPGANAYQFQIDESTGFGDPLFTSPVLTVASYKPVVALTVMTPYYWHVRARDAAGNWGDYSPYRTITIVPAVPTAPVQTAPAASLITSDNTPEFTWNAVTTGNTYQIQIDNLANFSAPAAPDIDLTLGAGVRTYTPAALLDGIWYWRVRAISLNNEVGPWSTSR